MASTLSPSAILDYLNSFEMALVLKDEVDGEDVHAIFAHGRPLEFWGCPRLLVSKVIEAFVTLQPEPTYLDVTINALHFVGVMKASEAWPLVYATHLPCYACTTVETVEGRSIPQDTSRFMPRMIGPDEKVDFTVEKFHVSSKCFRKQLTLELHYQLVRGPADNERE